MGLPNFTADLSLYKTTGHYRMSSSLASPAGTAQLSTLGPKSCDSNAFDACRNFALENYQRCILDCSPWCSQKELSLGTCFPGNMHCCLCLQKNSYCKSTFDTDTKACEAIGCPQGFTCIRDVKPPRMEFCCPSGTTACGGACISCSPPFQVDPDPVTCQCKCPPTLCNAPFILNPTTCQCECPPISCAAPLVPNSSTCRCECPPQQCTGGKYQDPITCQCVCLIGLTDCDGVCTNLQTDRQNCGTCGTTCGLREDCCGGTCRPLTTVWDCGSCGNSCQSGQDCCSFKCTSLNTTLNCGACGNKCTGGKHCQNGACVCPTGLTDCAGKCVNLQNNPQNCGQCGQPCREGICENGKCVCAPGQITCSDGSCCSKERPHCCYDGYGCCWKGYPVCCLPNAKNPEAYCCPQGTSCCADGCC